VAATTVSELRALAELRHRDPELVRARSTAIVAGDQPDEVRAAARWVLGLALHELGRAREAIPHYRAAVRDGDEVTAAAARASLAMSLLAAGDATGARRELDRAREQLPPAAVRHVEPLWAVFLQRTGNLDQALTVFDRVIPLLDREQDRAGLARALLNRGTLLAYQGRFGRAVDDLAGAEDLATELGHTVLVAMAAHNLGFTEGRRFALPAGLAAFDRARTAYRSAGDPPRQVAVLTADHCELLLHAGLAEDAREAAREALTSTAGLDLSHETEIRLLLAQAELQCGNTAAAVAEADRAADGFRRARRGPWAAYAAYVAVRAEVLHTEETLVPAPALLARARRTARALEAGGWPTEAAHARALVGRLALALGRHSVARAELTAVAGARRGGVDVRATAWHARALLRLADDDRPGARRALRRGLELVEEHRATLGAVELRAGAAVQAQELARLGVRLALEDQRPLEVLRWVERSRAGALRPTPVTPPGDPDLADALAELHAERAAGGRRVAALEAGIKSRMRRARPAGATAVAGPDIAGLRRALAGTLVEYLAVERRLWAVVLTSSGARLVDLGDTEIVASEVTYLLAEHRRILSGRRVGSGPSATADRLNSLLLEPLGTLSRDLVIVPSGMLHDLPWSALPGLYGRRAVIAPSADLWHRRRRPHTADGRTLLVAGPGLPAASTEIAAIRAVHPTSTVLAGDDATVSAVLDGLGRADLVHLVAHGRFRADSPQFSALELADRPLTVYELESLPAAPATVVLPACDAGRATVLTGDELLGTTTAFLGRGVRSVIAPVLPVPDEATARLMPLLHRRLAGGAPPSTALADTATEVVDDPELRAVAAAFVCAGAAEEPVRAGQVPSPRTSRPESAAGARRLPAAVGSPG
jgi:tetratricopeptide (TPR) repeat protein